MGDSRLETPWAGGILAVLLCPAVLATETDKAGIRVQVEVVLVDVVVVDDKGEPVTGLGKDDFEVFEEGKRQVITDFEAVVRQAVTPSSGPPEKAPSVETQESKTAEPTGTKVEGGAFMFLFDTLDTAPHDIARAKESAKALIARELAASDRAAALYYDGHLKLVSEMTSDRSGLVAAIDEFRASGKNARSGTLSRWEALDLVGRMLGEIPGRKTLLLFARSFGAYGEMGQTVEPLDEDEEAFQDLKGYERMVALMNAANVAVYPVDVDGQLAAPGDAGGADARASRTSGYGAEPKEPGPRRRYTMGERRAPRRRASLGAGELALDRFATSKVLADETGGEAIVYGQDIDEKLSRIVRLASNYYLLSYAPSEEAEAGESRSLAVKVKRPGLRVLSRNGYVKGLSARLPEEIAPR